MCRYCVIKGKYYFFFNQQKKITHLLRVIVQQSISPLKIVCICFHFTVATWPRCWHIIFNLSLAIGNIIFGCFKLFAIRYWSIGWTTIWTSLCKMVDLFDTLGFNGMCCTSMAWCMDCNTRNDGRSRWFWYV